MKFTKVLHCTVSGQFIWATSTGKQSFKMSIYNWGLIFSSFRLKYIYLKIQLVFLFATFDSLFAHSKKLAGIHLDLPKDKEDEYQIHMLKSQVLACFKLKLTIDLNRHSISYAENKNCWIKILDTKSKCIFNMHFKALLALEEYFSTRSEAIASFPVELSSHWYWVVFPSCRQSKTDKIQVSLNFQVPLENNKTQKTSKPF